MLRRGKSKPGATYGNEFQDMLMCFHLELSQVCRNIVLRIPLPSHRMSDMIEGGHPRVKSIYVHNDQGEIVRTHGRSRSY